MFLTWQDLVLGIGGFVFAPSLVPMILKSPKPPLLTSVPTAVVLWGFMVAMGSLGLWLGSFSVALTASAWTTLAIQRVSEHQRQTKV